VDKDGKVTAFEYLASYADRDVACRVLNLAIATKINYFTTNHHTGQGEMTKFIRKVFATLYPKQAAEM